MEASATVLLSDSEAGASLARGLTSRNCPVVWYTSLEELVRQQSFPSISVLIFHLRRPPKGNLLVVIGRMAIEFPSMQKVAVVESPLSLVVVEYLTARGVDLIWTEPKAENLDQLVSIVQRMQQRRTWCVAERVG